MSSGLTQDEQGVYDTDSRWADFQHIEPENGLRKRLAIIDRLLLREARLVALLERAKALEPDWDVIEELRPIDQQDGMRPSRDEIALEEAMDKFKAFLADAAKELES